MYYYCFLKCEGVLNLGRFFFQFLDCLLETQEVFFSQKYYSNKGTGSAHSGHVSPVSPTVSWSGRLMATWMLLMLSGSLPHSIREFS